MATSTAAERVSVSAELSLRDTPTLSYHPREGREIAKSLLTPLSSDLFIVVNAGADIEQLLLLTINDINDVPNAPTIHDADPEGPRRQFRIPPRAFGFSRHSASETAPSWRSGPTKRPMAPPTRSPRNRSRVEDLLERRQGRLRLSRPNGNGQVTLLKREKDLVLKIRAGFVNLAEMAEVARIFHLKPGLNMYKIKSELTDEANQRANDAPQPTRGETRST